MEPNVKKELHAYLQMVRNWSKSYLGMIEGSSGNEYLIEDLTDTVAEHMMPQLRAYVRTEQLTSAELNGFRGELAQVVDMFVAKLKHIQRGNANE